MENNVLEDDDTKKVENPEFIDEQTINEQLRKESEFVDEQTINEQLRKAWEELDKQVSRLSFLKNLYQLTVLALFILAYVFTFSIFFDYSFFSFISYNTQKLIVFISVFSFVYLLFGSKNVLKKDNYHKVLKNYQELHQVHNTYYKLRKTKEIEQLQVKIGRELVTNEEIFQGDFSFVFVLFSAVSVFLILTLVLNHKNIATQPITYYNKAYLLADSTPWLNKEMKDKFSLVEKTSAYKVKNYVYRNNEQATINKMQNLIVALKQKNDSLAKENALLLRTLDSLRMGKK